MEIVKNTRVRFVRKPADEKFIQHFELSKEYLDLGKKYVVEHVFAGNPSQLELQGIPAMLFASDMFDIIED